MTYATKIEELIAERDELRKDAERLNWAERNPADFLSLVLGKCPDGHDGLRVYACLTGNTLDSGALEIGPAQWDMRTAIDVAMATSK